MNELVSVIIPTYNGSTLIEKAIKSVQGQSYSNIEIIVVDDNGFGSLEQKKTEEVVRRLQGDKRIKYIAHEVNKNGSAARNTGVKESSGKYIALLDDDDEYLPRKIQMEVEALSELDESWGMVYCSCDKNRGIPKKSGNLLYNLLVHTIVIGSNSFLVRRSIWDAVNGFDESFKRHQDFEFTARVAAVCKIKGLDECGFIYNAEVGRNKARNIIQLQDHRKHYIDKMMPLIRTFDTTRQKRIICSNSMQVTSPYLKHGNVVAFVRELKKYMAQWEPHCDNITIIVVAFQKIYDRLYKKAKKTQE